MQDIQQLCIVQLSYNITKNNSYKYAIHNLANFFILQSDRQSTCVDVMLFADITK